MTFIAETVAFRIGDIEYGSPLFILLVVSTVFCSCDLFLGISGAILKRSFLLETSHIPSIYSPDKSASSSRDQSSADVELTSANPILMNTIMPHHSSPITITSFNKSKYLEASIRMLITDHEKKLNDLIGEFEQNLLENQEKNLDYS